MLTSYDGLNPIWEPQRICFDALRPPMVHCKCEQVAVPLQRGIGILRANQRNTTGLGFIACLSSFDPDILSMLASGDARRFVGSHTTTRQLHSPTAMSVPAKSQICPRVATLLLETRECHRIVSIAMDRGIIDHTKRSFAISRAQAMVFRDTDVSRSDERRPSRLIIQWMVNISRTGTACELTMVA